MNGLIARRSSKMLRNLFRASSEAAHDNLLIGFTMFTSNRPRHGIFAIVAILASLMTGMIASAAEAADEKRTVGRAEKVWIKHAGIFLNAKMDTGTLTSSLDARDIHVFKEDDRVWVRFVLKDAYGKSITLKRLLVRSAHFKKQGYDVENRPVIELGLCIADIYHLTEVNLSDRQRFTYPLLIGRRFLTGRVVVDTAKKYVNRPRCNEMPKEGHSSPVVVPRGAGPSGE